MTYDFFGGGSSLTFCKKSLRHLSKLSNDFGLVISYTRIQASAPRKNATPRDWKRSCPAVSQICSVTSLSSIVTSFVQKSAPMVALYCSENLLFTYWFISEVFPTPESPRIITFSSTFFRCCHG